ncbi:MAG: hypothetical protein AAF503_05450 [Pseudomonadota bacterium]
MKSLITAVFAALVTFAPTTAPAETGNSSLNSFEKETAKARAAGGYGNPIIAVPLAVANTMTAAAGVVVVRVEYIASSISVK